MIGLKGEEGGGQILRTALALSMFTRQPFSMANIRAKRPNPGLRPQHLQCILAAKELSDAYVEGSEVGSKEILFVPKDCKAKSMTIDIGTAGSTILLLQSVLLPCLFAKRGLKLKVMGGTTNKAAPPYHYFAHVFLPYLSRFADIQPRLRKTGYYPKGGGEVEVAIKPLCKGEYPQIIEELNTRIKPFDLIEKARVVHIRGVSHASTELLQARVAERQARAAQVYLSSLAPVNITTEYANTLSIGSGITLWAVMEYGENVAVHGADMIGEKGVPAEQIGILAAEKLGAGLGGGIIVDEFLADQIIPFLALLRGSRMRTTQVSDHAMSNCRTVEKFLPVTFKIEGNTICCEPGEKRE